MAERQENRRKQDIVFLNILFCPACDLYTYFIGDYSGDGPGQDNVLGGICAV